LANPGDASNQLTLTLQDQNGNAAGSPVTLTLAPRQQTAKFISDLFPAGVIGAQFTGSVRLQSATPFAALGLRFSGIQFSTLPIVLTATPSAANAGVLPQFAIGADWATQIALVNSSGSTISGSINFFDPSGNPLAVT